MICLVGDGLLFIQTLFLFYFYDLYGNHNSQLSIVNSQLSERIRNAHFPRSFHVALLYLALAFALLFLYLLGFLLVERFLVDVPVERYVPLRLALYLVRIVEHLFGLQVGAVVARVPHAVVVAVDEQAGVVFAGRT